MALDAERPSETRGLFAIAAVVLVVIAAISNLRTRAPTAEPSSAPNKEFSGERARSTLGAVLGAGAAHPVGSPENDAVRERIVARLRELGMKPELETGMGCSRWGTCAHVTNVVARKAGKSELPAVLLAAHYDSVPAGAGASDDGLGVATLLETARAMADDPPGERAVWFLFDDGEEAGLLGAEAFVRKHDVRREIGVVLNVEARGTRGPSLMFETSGESAPLVDLFAKSARRPLTSSLFYSVYKRLPNDTDLTVFKRDGVPGLNFAVIGDVQHYHTSLDDFAHASSASLQHHGESVLGLTRRLADSPTLPGMHGGDAVFFDLLGTAVVRWPIGWTRPIAIVVATLWFVAIGLAFKKRVLRPSGFLRAFAVWPLAPALSTLFVFGLFAALKALGRLPAFAWLAHPLPALTIAPAVAWVVHASSIALRKRSTATDEWAACFSWWSFFLVALAFALPEASYLFLLPIAGAAIAGLFLSRGRAAHFAASLAPIVLTGAIWFPVLGLTYDALGFAVPALFGAATSLALAPFAVTLGSVETAGRRLIVALGAIVVVVAWIVAVRVPIYSPESPSRTSIAYVWKADARRSRYLVEAPARDVPASLLAAAQFSDKPVDPAPWIGTWREQALEAPAPAIELPPPYWLVVEINEAKDSFRTRVRLRSMRGARVLGAFVPLEAGLRSVRVDGHPAQTRTIGRFQTLTLLGLPPDGADVEFELSHATSVLIWDQTAGLPSGADSIAKARPSWAVPSQLGDVSIASLDIPLAPLR